MKQINIIGIPPLTDKIPEGGPLTAADALAYRGGVRLVITKDSNTYMLLGKVEQLLITGKARPDWGLIDNEKATIIITENPGGGAPPGWEGSTLKISLPFTLGEGKIIGNRGTGIFEKAQFRGTYSMAGAAVFIPIPPYVAVYKAQWGTGEIMFS